MGTKNPSPAKITKPKITGISPRKRLFRLLDQGRKKPVTWVSAPAGSGKTTLIASYLDSRKIPCIWYQVDGGDGDIASFFYYMGQAAKLAAPRYKKQLPLLTPEYIQGIPVFTRRYFEELFSRLKPPAAIVFDNYQDAPLRSGFHEMIAHVLDVIPGGVSVIVISRGEPPAGLSRLKANNRIELLGWDEIRFTFEESSDLMSAQWKKLSKEAQKQLYEKTEGWAAGLVLMVESASRGGLHRNALPNTQQEVFDYFASEIFDKSDKEIQDLLLKTAFLVKIDPAVAEKLTGIDSAGQILEKLSRYHYFTQRYVNAYQYHPLFREFLQTRARSTFSGTDLAVLLRNAAELLADGEGIEEAIELLKETKEWERISRLVDAHAPKLLAEGRNKTIEAWLRAIPGHLLRQMPWALYWLGTCCLPFDQIEARAHYEEAYRRFKQERNIAGRYLAWAGIADSFIYLWDDFSGMKPWLSELEQLQREHPRFPSAQAEARVSLGAFSTMYYMDPGNPTVERWRQRVETLMRELPDPNFKCQAAGSLALHYLWHGTRSDVRSVLHYIGAFRDHPEATPLSRILVRHAMAISEWNSLESDSAVAFCEEGLQIAEEYGVHMMDIFLFAHKVYAYGYRSSEPSVMGPILDRMRDRVLPQRRLDAAHYHYLMAWYLSLCHRYDEALMHCREAAVLVKLSVVSPTAFVYINTAQILLLAGRFDEAAANLAQAEEMVKHHGCVMAGYKAGFVRAVLALKCGSKQEQVREVRNILELAIRLGYWSYIIPHPDILQSLCAFALEEGIESDYAVSMIRRNGLQPPVNAPDSWPWPIKIATLGRLEVRKDDKPVPFAGKKKQLELLKVLIAHGGSSVREEQVTDVLWPDAEGDDAHNSFKMTLSRLRGLVGNEAVPYEQGLYSLNRAMVRVDAWDFERLCEQAIGLWRNRESKDKIAQAAGMTEKALEAYRGPFLPDDACSAWTVSTRERLRNKLLRVTMSAGRYYEEKGKWKFAADFYEKALETDRLQEEFYQRLMVCHHKLGRPAEALAVYDRCCSELSALGIKPSPATESLLLDIRK